MQKAMCVILFRVNVQNQDRKQPTVLGLRRESCVMSVGFLLGQ